ncbi:MAG: hypothetical protein GX155_09250, partial [Smithella sp.]|nr:hypothetical protein [Smithella sp.]
AEAIQSELQKAGVTLTPAEIQKGKQMLEQRADHPLTDAEIQQGREMFESRKKETPQDGRPAEDIKADTEEADLEDTLFHRTRQFGQYQDISLRLRRFGHEFFRHTAAVSAARKDVPVPLNYVIGSGDQINILLWGRLSAQHSLTVDRDGKITIPQIGPVYVAGMTYEQMSKHVIAKAQQITGTNIDITVGSTRSIPVFVLGDVRRPGAYTTGAMSSVTDALIMAGGPSAIGSMRRIEIRRGEKMISYFDLYDLFLKGDKSRDITLQAGDVVFVPVTGPQAGIAGNVKRPAIYELRDKFDLAHLIDLAGGIIPSAYTQQMQVERIIKNEKQVVIDINDKTLSLVRDFVLQDADMVKIFPIVDRDENAIYLSGNVKRPGKYSFRPGMRVRDLVGDTNDLLEATHFDYSLIKRQTPPDKAIVLIPFNLGKLILQNDESQNFELTPKDQVFIFNRNLFIDPPIVTVEGEIRGSSTDVHQDPEQMDAGHKARNQSILAELRSVRAGLESEERFYIYAAKIEEIEDEIEQERRPAPGALRYLEAELEKAGRNDLTARLKRLESRMQVVRQIDLAGNMKVKDAILKAGGLTGSASMENGEIVREYAKNEYKTTYFNVARAMAEDPRHNLPLQDKDKIIIHSIWEQNPKASVFVTGDVTNPGTYQFTSGMTVYDLVFKAGNVLESAYLEEAEITSVNVVNGRLGNLVHKNINLKKALAGDAIHNLSLSPNDRLLVKRIADYQKIRMVTLTGQVSFPGKYPFRKGEKLSDLIERAGGFTPYAYLRGANFTRERVRQLQQQGLEEMTARMERDLLSAGAEQVSTALSSAEIAAKQVELEQKKRFIDLLRQSRATGRMTVRLADAKTLRDSEYDFELEDADTLHVPEKNNAVSVMGSVMSQGSHLYSDQYDYQDYIELTGGYSHYADTRNVYVLKVDGSARRVSGNFIGWSASRARWEMTAYGGEIRTIEPGDTIVVPEKAERIAWLREIKDITTIMMNLAVVAGVIVAAF